MISVYKEVQGVIKNYCYQNLMLQLDLKNRKSVEDRKQCLIYSMIFFGVFTAIVSLCNTISWNYKLISALCKYNTNFGLFVYIFGISLKK